MNAPSPMRVQLEGLRIPLGQRPTERAVRVPRARRWPRMLIGLVLLAGAGAGIAVLASRGHFDRIMQTVTPAVDVRTITIATRLPASRQPVLTATGKIVSDHRVAVVTKVSGQIVELSFEQGDRVDKGQMIAQIEETNYRARRDQGKAMLEKTQANLAYQKINFSRVSDLVNRGVAKAIEFADAKRDLDETRAQLAADEAALEWAQKALDDCRVVAPIAGVILERNVEVGDFVAAEGGRGAMANAQFALIADMSTLRVEVDVSELDITRLKRDMPCEVTPDAYKDRRYCGHVMWLDPAANYSKATVQVKVRIDEPDEYLRVEGSAKVTFLPPESATRPAAEAELGIWIPQSALFAEPIGDSGRVYVIVEGRLKAMPVSLGRRQGDEVQVLSGLRPGDQLVPSGTETLSPGQKVKSPGS